MSNLEESKSQIINKKLREIEIIKAIAIFLIVATHMGVYASHDYLGFLQPYLGRAGLGLFIFVSGYSLYHNYRKMDGSGDIIKFYKKRLVRIVPLYWFSLIIQTFLIYNTGTGENITIGNFLACAAGLQVLLSPKYVDYSFWGLWYIGMILILYAIYPLIIYNGKKNILLNSCVIFLVFLLTRFSFDIIDIRFFLYYFIFITGILIKSINLPENRLYNTIVRVSPFIFVMLTYIRYRYINFDVKEEYLSEANPILIILSLGGLIFSFVILSYDIIISNIDLLNRRLFNFFEYISTASFPLYLLHQPVLYTVKLYMYPHINNEVLSDLVMLFIIIPALTISCYQIQIYEKPVLKKLNNYLNLNSD